MAGLIQRQPNHAPLDRRAARQGSYRQQNRRHNADVNLETRRPDRPVPPMAGTAAVGAVVHLLATAIEEGRDLSSMSGILADSSYRLLPA